MPIDPISGNATSTITAANATRASTSTTPDQFGKDTFLKLLVAQLKYQNPMSPADGTQFLAQTAQFTMVEKLQEINQAVKSNAAANEVLEASSMIAKRVNVATKNGKPIVTTADRVGGNLPTDAPLGTKVTANSTMYTSSGTQVPVAFEFTKAADGADGSKHWVGRAKVSTVQIGSTFNLDFDSHGERTSPDISFSAKQLEAVPDTVGKWDAAGAKLDLGSANDPNRLQVGGGASTVSELGQNGSDGKSVDGVVSSVKFTSTGPLLSINGKDYSLSDVTSVHATT